MRLVQSMNKVLLLADRGPERCFTGHRLVARRRDAVTRWLGELSVIVGVARVL